MRPATRMRRAASDDAGSILPLTFGYMALALVTVLVCADATSLYIEQKRLDGIADGAALAAADAFTVTLDGDGVRAVLAAQDVRAQAEAFVAAVAPTARLVDTAVPDGASARVTVAEAWHPPVLTLFVPDGLELSSTATGRSALR